MKKRLLVLISAAVVIAALIVLISGYHPGYKITLTDADTGQVYGTYSLTGSNEFSVTFVHSVNKTPVTDVYEVREDGDIWLTETIYYDFDAGVPSELYGDQTFRFGGSDEDTDSDDSTNLTIENMDTLIPTLTYRVGTVSDHTLTIYGDDGVDGAEEDNTEIGLRDLCGRNSPVRFTAEKTYFCFQ